MSQSIEEIESNTAALEAKLAKVQAALAEKRKRKAIKNAKPTPVKFESLFDAQAQGLKAAMPNATDEAYLQALLIQQVRHLEHMLHYNGTEESYTGPNYYANCCRQEGRVQGIAAVLATLRKTNVSKEILKAQIADDNDMG